MRKICTALGLLVIGLLMSCDDGNIVYKDIDFSSSNQVNNCNTKASENIFYKIQQSEVLILQVDAANLLKDPQVKEVTTTIDGTSTKLEYRNYNDNVSSASICEAPAPAFPIVLKSIAGSEGGKVQIVRNIAINNEPTSNVVSLAYQYAFYLHNIDFSDQDTNIKYDKMFFGTNNYKNNALNFNFKNTDDSYKPVSYCEQQFYTLSDKEAIILNIKQSDLPTQATSEPVVLTLNDSQTVTFKQYQKGGINLEQVCSNPGDIPGTSDSTINTLIELWVANKGEIHISTRLTNPAQGQPILVHTISLVNITFSKDQYTELNFVKDQIILGEYRAN